MTLRKRNFAVLFGVIIIGFSNVEAKKKVSKPGADDAETAVKGSDILWKNPTDISTRNLFYGPGGKEHEPHGRMTFVEEDLEGTNPKFVVRDAQGVKWKVKLGLEARPETAASRIVWAAGYFANEDYFVADLKVDNMPDHLHRGQDLVDPDGTVHNVRLKRNTEGEKKVGEWSWADNPFAGTRQLNGLRVVMAVINNWDLKDENNAVLDKKGHGQRVYMVSDLGASFGTPGISFPLGRSKGDLGTYRGSKFIVKKDPADIDFGAPGNPTPLDVVKPGDFSRRKKLRWIGQHVPREDAKWMGEVLERITPEQIADAFRAAGYKDEDIQGFVAVIESRVAELTHL
jgi:hypothetical protein